jgi:hypothetical protein
MHAAPARAQHAALPVELAHTVSAFYWAPCSFSHKLKGPSLIARHPSHSLTLTPSPLYLHPSCTPLHCHTLLPGQRQGLLCVLRWPARMGQVARAQGGCTRHGFTVFLRLCRTRWWALALALLLLVLVLLLECSTVHILGRFDPAVE